MGLPIVRSHERMDYKRCVKKWYWKWRVGLAPKAITFGALDLGTWMHEALATWYGIGHDRNGNLAQWFTEIADTALESARQAGAPEHALDKAEELAALGEAMATAYERHYATDPEVYVLGVELPLEFTIPDETGKVVAVHKLKPDLVYLDPKHGAWLMEHKTAAQVRTEHLVIDDQARPYGAMAESALRKLKKIRARYTFKGIMYNYLRKGLPDERATNADGRALNKNGSVSQRQPSPLFVRKPVFLTNKAKAVALRRIRNETLLITLLAQAIRDKKIRPIDLPKTPHNSCPRTCQYFTMCVAEEEGTDVTDMQRAMFTRQDPYAYGETTEEPVGFEMG